MKGNIMSSINSIAYKLCKSKHLHESTVADTQYRHYLESHRAGVREYYEKVLRPVLHQEGISHQDMSEIEMLIETHDASKYGEEEFGAYRDYFYDPEHHSRSSEAFNLAWLHHQNHNPHHWQYWVLINDVDEPQVHPLDMPFKYIMELLCDWASAGRHYGNTAYSWYQQQKDKLIITDRTRDILEKYIVYFK